MVTAPHHRRPRARSPLAQSNENAHRAARTGTVGLEPLLGLGGLVTLALGFGNVLMLGWLAAAAAPIIIHLWNRRKYREVSWAAIDFLLAAMRRHARKIQLQQWLLLAVRTLLIALVVLAVAEPFLQRSGKAVTLGRRTHKVLVLDGSYSMAYRSTDTTRFAEAKRLATQIVEQSSQGDGFTLVLMSAPARIIVGSPAFEPDTFIEEIENLQLPHTGGDLLQAVVQVEEIIERAQQEHSGLEQHEVYFLTDLGRHSWAPDAAGSQAEQQLHEQIDRLSKRATLIVPDLWQPPVVENAAVTHVHAVEPFATIYRDMVFEVQIRNFGAQRRERQLVELLVDQQRVKEQYVDLEPGGQTTITFAHRFETPGQHVACVRLPHDLLELDNSRWLAVDVKEHLRVLCVGGQESSTEDLVLALDPDGAENSLVQPTVAPESALQEMDLDEFDCIFFSNVGQFTGSEARLLDSYLKQGGGVVFFLGDRVVADRYNRELAGEGPSGIRILPAKLGEVLSEAQYQLDPLDYKHPIVSPFRGREQAGLLTTPVYRYFRLIRPEDWTSSRVALAFAGGDPAIVESPIHRGRSILVAFPASMDSIDPATKNPWTTAPAWASYLPIVQELLAAAVGSQSVGLNILVGGTLTAEVPPTASGVPLSMLLPDGRSQSLRVTDQQEEARWSFPASDLSGVYTAQFGKPLDLSEPFAVNVDTAESDLTKVDLAELPRGLRVEEGLHDFDDAAAVHGSRPSGIHKTLLYCALGLVFLETFLAWRFGRGMA